MEIKWNKKCVHWLVLNIMIKMRKWEDEIGWGILVRLENWGWTWGEN